MLEDDAVRVMFDCLQQCGKGNAYRHHSAAQVRDSNHPEEQLVC